MNYDYEHLIIGGGMTADAAAKGIRSVNGVATIGIEGLFSGRLAA